MKRSLGLLITFTCLWSLPVQGSETALARLWCFSPRFQAAEDLTGEYRMELTTLSVGINGELAPDYGGDFTHSAWVEVTDQYLDETLQGVLFVDVPDAGDANGNGWNDFFEVSQGVTATSTGYYQVDGLGSGSVSASWWRGAGSHAGTCVLKFQPNAYYTLAIFTHTFEILEYTGPLVYTPGSNTVTGNVSLSQTEGSDQFLGRLQFVKNDTNRFDELMLQAGRLTNAAAQTLTFWEDLYTRDAGWPTNYYGYFDFDDGDPNTSEPDYYTWVLSIDDANDSDRDGIPDFSDDPQAPTPPRRPRLSLTQQGGGLGLLISGDTGHRHDIQQASSADAPNWQPFTSITLTNDPQVVTLPWTTGGPKFWRVVAQ